MSIKDFTILAELGKGAYSSVYKVQRTIDQQYYALKKVKLVNLSEKQLQNALNQVRILASIHHPNIVAYKDAFLQGKNLCIVMQHMDDGDLYQKICQKKKKKNNYFNENQIWRVLIHTVRGLKKLHSMKIFHRDMKSANIFLNKKGQAKLGDMNVSKIAKQGLLYTQTGTPYYASPQVWNQKPYDSKSDIWSLGVVIYQMTALNVPFQAQDMEGLANTIVKGKFEHIPEHYSEDLWRMICLMLELNPNKRPSAQKLCKSSLFKKKCKQIDLQDFNDPQTDDLLSTIRIPKKLQYLTDRLPNPNYIDNRDVSRSASQRRSVVQNRINSHKSMNKASFPKLDRLLKYHEQKIVHDNKKRSIHDRSSVQVTYDRNSIQNYEAYSRQKVKQIKRPPLNRKQILQQDLKRIQQGKHQVNSRQHRYY